MGHAIKGYNHVVIAGEKNSTSRASEAMVYGTREEGREGGGYGIQNEMRYTGMRGDQKIQYRKKRKSYKAHTVRDR